MTQSRLCILTFAATCIINAGWSFADAVPGDFNEDGIVDLVDYARMADCLAGPTVPFDTGCGVCDLDSDGRVDLDDFASLVQFWNFMNCRADASASSVENGDPAFAASMAVDGFLGTRWASEFADNQWIQIDLNHVRNLNGLTIHWETASARIYKVSVSQDGNSWTTVHTETNGDGGVDSITFAATQVRFVKIDCLIRNTEWGNSIWEVVMHSDDNCYSEPVNLEDFISGLIDAMTLEEKTTLLYGESYMDLHAVPRLGIPSLKLADGPLGIRHGDATAFPAPIALASTWDTELVNEVGVAFGKEWRNKGRHVCLGPCMNIVRVPHGGRNFETYGEDPFLNSRMAVAMIKGIQSQGIIACAKHYVCNNQELDRFNIDVQVEERALREIFLPAFKASVIEAGVWSVMSAYNRINGPYATANAYLQQTILKDEWGFPGFVVSDWGAVHDTVGPANAGMDLEMDLASPVGAFWGNGQLMQAVLDGYVSESTIDEKVRRVLRALYSLDATKIPGEAPDVELVEHRELVRRAGRSGIVLLKNEGDILPLDKNVTQTLALIGPNYKDCRTGGGGSSQVSPYRTVGPLAGIFEVAGPNVTLLEALGAYDGATPPPAVDSSWLSPSAGSGQGLYGEYFNNTSLTGSPILTRVDSTIDFSWGEGSPAAGVNADNFSVRWTGTLRVPTSGTYTLGMTNDDGARVYLDGNVVIDDWNNHAAEFHSADVWLEADQDYDLRVEYYESGGSAVAKLSCFEEGGALNEAVAAATQADVAIVFVGLSASSESEGYDRSSMDLDAAQVELIQAVAAANPQTVVVVIAGSQVGMGSWIDGVPAMMQAWYLGQEGGYSIADVIFGDENPSGKLPFSFVRRWEDHFAYGVYPSPGNVYTEGIFVGYRYYDHAGVEPLFPFGFGLSYTEFSMSNPQMDTNYLSVDGTMTVSVDVTNVGTRAGAEVVQVYVRDIEASVPRPDKELKGFAKVYLEPGETTRVTISLDNSSFAFYDDTVPGWKIEPGRFAILVGNSSRNIILTGAITHP